MGKIVYVTGAPATGKSTLCRNLVHQGPGIEAFCYSERLRDHVSLHTGAVLDEAGIRNLSARVVTARHVAEVDELLRQKVEEAKMLTTHLLIDSHPVTKEDYGFRVTPFSSERLCCLGIDSFICLFAAPDVLAERIRSDAAGRPLPTDFELSVHVELQAAVVAQYSVLTGKVCHLVDSSIPATELASKVRELAGI